MLSEFKCDPLLWQAIVAVVGLHKAMEILEHAKEMKEFLQTILSVPMDVTNKIIEDKNGQEN